MTAVAEFAALSDPDLIAERGRIRAELERLSPDSDDRRRELEVLYGTATQELDYRATAAWSSA